MHGSTAFVRCQSKPTGTKGVATKASSSFSLEGNLVIVIVTCDMQQFFFVAKHIVMTRKMQGQAVGAASEML